MSAKAFDILLQTAFDTENPAIFEEGATEVYTKFERVYRDAQSQNRKAADELSYRFERLRLGIAIAFVKAFNRLASNEKSKEALDTLQEAIKASSTREIDKIIQKKISSFDHLYHEIFVNEQREEILHLFERTLDAGTKDELDELIFEGLDLLQDVDWDAVNDEGDDHNEPLDEDFLKNL